MAAPSIMFDLANEAEFQATEQALKSARNVEELASIWWRYADRFEGEAREKLQRVYTRQLFKCGALQP